MVGAWVEQKGTSIDVIGCVARKLLPDTQRLLDVAGVGEDVVFSVSGKKARRLKDQEREERRSQEFWQTLDSVKAPFPKRQSNPQWTKCGNVNSQHACPCPKTAGSTVMCQAPVFFLSITVRARPIAFRSTSQSAHRHLPLRFTHLPSIPSMTYSSIWRACSPECSAVN